MIIVKTKYFCNGREKNRGYENLEDVRHFLNEFYRKQGSVTTYYTWDERGNALPHDEENEREADSAKMINLIIERTESFGSSLFATDKAEVSIYDTNSAEMKRLTEKRRSLLRGE